MSSENIKVGFFIAASYDFLITHMWHFLRLSFVPMLLWAAARLLQEVLLQEYGIIFDSNILLACITASFALVWYRQFLLGSELATYRGLFKRGFSGDNFSISRLARSGFRICVITLALIIPTLIISISVMVYYNLQGVKFDQAAIRELAIQSTFGVMLMASPVLARISLYTVAVALGRRSMRLRDVWEKTKGFSLILAVLVFRAFLPLAIYTQVLSWLLENIATRLEMHYVWASLLVNIPAGFLTLMMLSIVVASNAEAFRILIGFREGDAPHRPDAGVPRSDPTETTMKNKMI